MLNQTLEKHGVAYSVIQPDGSVKVFSSWFAAIQDAYDVPRTREPLSDEHKAQLRSNLDKARQARSERAREKAAHRQAVRDMKRAEDPARYDAIQAKRREALEKARAVRFGNKTEGGANV
jgi:hypothetical protein